MALGQTWVYRERGLSMGSESENPTHAWFPLSASVCPQGSPYALGFLRGHLRRPREGLAILNEGGSLRWAHVTRVLPPPSPTPQVTVLSQGCPDVQSHIFLTTSRTGSPYKVCLEIACIDIKRWPVLSFALNHIVGEGAGALCLQTERPGVVVGPGGN